MLLSLLHSLTWLEHHRESYPPYGFYILNRMGMDDYIQRLYPEDDIGAHGSYLMLRSYPDFTARRLVTARAASPDSCRIPHKFADVYAIEAPEKLLEKEKGRSQTVGLWMFATDAREPMIDVMLRCATRIISRFRTFMRVIFSDSTHLSRKTCHTQKNFDMDLIDLHHLIRIFALARHRHHTVRNYRISNVSSSDMLDI